MAGSLRHLARAAGAVCSRGALLGAPQGALLRAVPVASLLNFHPVVYGPSAATATASGAAGYGVLPPALWPRSFASSALTAQRPEAGAPGGWGGAAAPGSSSGSSSAAGGGSPAAGSGRGKRGQARGTHSGALPAEEPAPASHPAQRTSFKVEAAYVGSKIGIYDLMNRAEFAGHYKKLHKGTVVLGLTPRAVDPAAEITGMPLGPYMVAFSYGSVVFFNTDKEMKDAYLQICRQGAADPLPEDKMYAEEYTVTVDPSEQIWSRLEADNVTLQQLDLKNIQVISQVLAQSVAMDFYSSHVERTLETFCNMNLEMQQTKNIAKINKQVLLQMVAENNIVMTDIINKLGVHERYDIAWKHVQYGRIWEFLRAELEMDARFKTLDMKLNLIQDNLKYFLEILQNRKSDTLEWIIIVLIGAEICLSLYDLASKGLG